jgi:8-oxo-dGTP pyrophosphatase MutT (NUDIX family)
MELTIGIFLFNAEKKLLICYPTGGGPCSIPKGLIDNNETELECGLRELYEETNITLSKDLDYIELDIKKYKGRNKQIKAFVHNSEHMFTNLQCNSYFELNDKQFKEIEKFEWVDINTAIEKLHYLQKEYLIEILDKNFS